MATTTLLQRHAGEGETIAEAIRDCLDYGKDPEKTESGKYISAYECDPATVADEFLLAKASYHHFCKHNYYKYSNKKARIRYASIHRYDLETNRKNGTMRKLCTGCREPDTYSDIGNYFRADIDKRLDKCRDFLFVIYISINIVYCILHCGSSDYFDDYYFRFLQFTKNSVG